MNEEILVSIWCTAYNHESYIRQCLEGFVMQKTNFKFEAIVHDDASTDGTAAIIMEYAEKYPDIIQPIFQIENQYSQKHINMMQTFFMPRAKGKYIALCEGDDYWTDPYKLQKQVDFLEHNPEYGLVYGKTRVYDQKRGEFLSEIKGEFCQGVDDLILRNKIPTLTVMYRKELLLGYVEEIGYQHKWKMGDAPLWLYISIKTKIKFINEIFAVYRVLLNSASSRNDFCNLEKFINSGDDIRRFFVKKYNISLSDVELNDIRMKRLFFNSFNWGKRKRAYYYNNKIVKKNIKLKILWFVCRCELCYKLYRLFL